MSLDGTVKHFEQTDVYVSVTKPNPAYMQPQVLTQHRLDTSVDSQVPIRLLGRTLDFGGRRGRSGSYHVVQQAPARP